MKNFKTTGIFVILVALLVSSNFCLRNHHQLHSGTRQWLAKEQATSTSYSTTLSSPVKYRMTGSKSGDDMEGTLYNPDGSRYARWYLYKKQQSPVYWGYTNTNLKLLAQSDESNEFQGSIHDNWVMIIGKISFSLSDDGKVEGSFTIDTSNKVPLQRFDINKSDLKGIVYSYISESYKYITGNVVVKNVQGEENHDKYEGYLKTIWRRGWTCYDRFSYENADGAGVDQFLIPIQYDCQPPSSLAKVNSNSKMSEESQTYYTKAIKLRETDTTWTYGRDWR